MSILPAHGEIAAFFFVVVDGSRLPDVANFTNDFLRAGNLGGNGCDRYCVAGQSARGIATDNYVLSPHSVNLFVLVESGEAVVRTLHWLVQIGDCCRQPLFESSNR